MAISGSALFEKVFHPSTHPQERGDKKASPGQRFFLGWNERGRNGLGKVFTQGVFRYPDLRSEVPDLSGR